MSEAPTVSRTTLMSSWPGSWPKSSVRIRVRAEASIFIRSSALPPVREKPKPSIS